MTLLDPRDSYIQHFGVKGMKWGVRKDRAQRVGELKKAKEAHLGGYEDAAKSVEAKGTATAAKVRAQGKELVDSYEVAAQKEEAKGTPKSAIKAKGIRAEGKDMADSYEEAAVKIESNAKKKAAAIRAEAKTMKLDWDQAITRYEKNQKMTGKEIVNSIFTGDPNRRPTKKDVIRTGAGVALMGILLKHTVNS